MSYTADLAIILKIKINSDKLTPWKGKSEGRCCALQRAKRKQRKGDEEAMSCRKKSAKAKKNMLLFIADTRVKSEEGAILKEFNAL